MEAEQEKLALNIFMEIKDGKFSQLWDYGQELRRTILVPHFSCQQIEFQGLEMSHQKNTCQIYTSRMFQSKGDSLQDVGHLFAWMVATSRQSTK
jgi:hypothetical protein